MAAECAEVMERLGGLAADREPTSGAATTPSTR
jgi:hypothetical protein